MNEAKERVEDEEENLLPGDLVVWRKPKGRGRKFKQNEGPFRVCEVIANNLYEVRELYGSEKLKLEGKQLQLCHSRER